MRSIRKIKLLAILSLWSLAASASETETLEIYIDADYSVSSAAAHSIELGVRTALAEVGNRLGGLNVSVRPIDHHGNAKRSERTMQAYVESASALAIIGGMHSPPYLTYRSYINTSRILLLLPWSAAGPITRPVDGEENWIFRLSVDDAKAAGFLVRDAVDSGECRNIALILLETPWGRANRVPLMSALHGRGLSPAAVEFFDTTIGSVGAANLADRITLAEADCGILLANASDGAVVVKALQGASGGFRIFSHWGITGGDFIGQLDQDTLRDLDLRVLQTCALRLELDGSPMLRMALVAAVPSASSLAEVAAPTGFVHAYDLTRLLIVASEQAAQTPAWQDGIAGRRKAVHRALERLEAPVPGILKTYSRPFSAYSAANQDAHEALGSEDLCMARYTSDGRLVHAN